MAKFTQQELMAAHIIARHSSEVEAAENATASSVPELIDPYRKPLPWPDTEHPFGNNDNNRRVAERIAKEQLQYKDDAAVEAAPVTALDAALADLKAAREQAEIDGVPMTDEEDKAQADALLAAAIADNGANGKKATKTPARPTTAPAWTPGS